MSYDRIWIEDCKHQGEWQERSNAERDGLLEEFITQFDRLYSQGHYVVLVAGANFCFDELFLFEASANAQDFYDSEFLAWESFPEADDEGCGFQEVSLYVSGLRVATKWWAPTRRTEVNHV